MGPIRSVLSEKSTPERRVPPLLQRAQFFGTLYTSLGCTAAIPLTTHSLNRHHGRLLDLTTGDEVSFFILPFIFSRANSDADLQNHHSWRRRHLRSGLFGNN